MVRPKTRRVVLVSLVFAAGCAASLLAQADSPTGSLAELAAEIRQLRFAIEQSTRTQTQAQALGIFLSAQQSRLVQVTSRVDAARKERETAVERSITTAEELARVAAAMQRAADGTERAALEQRADELRAQMKIIATLEQQARTTEADMMQAWQQEEARWNDLISRLQQIAQP